MAQFPNNQFTNDTNAEHTIRCEFFVSGAATHGVELAFRGTLVADITSHLDTWKALEFQHEDEKGDVEAATGLINTLQNELEDLMVAGRYFVNSVLYEIEVEGIEEHDIRRDFGVEGKIPDGVEALVKLGRQMAKMNAQYIADGSAYALPAAPFEEIGTVAEELSDALDAKKVEHREQMHVGKLKEIERRKGDRMLSRGFNWTVAVWDYEDPRLEDMGFVPKSQIHTPGQPGPGQAEWPEAVANFVAVFMTFPMPLFNLSWDLLLKAITYNFYRTKAPLGNPDKNRPVDPVETGLTEPLLTDTNIEQGYVYVYWLCGVDENGVEGEFGEPLVMEYV